MLANSIAGMALAKFYGYYQNSTIYEYCEQAELFIETFLEGAVGIYLTECSQYGSTQGATSNYDLMANLFSSWFELSLFGIRQNLQRPLEFSNFQVINR